jgi:phenylalanyl-tRNA synthetase alpha chain
MIEKLKKRNLLSIVPLKNYIVTKGGNFSLEKQKLETELTTEMLKSGKWEQAKFKDFNFKALGKPNDGGHLHPLLKVRAFFREILLEMGFNEMPTDQFVESSFWNFDTLFQPQSHPARDLHDTFFLKEPATCGDFPPEYAKRV